jgi:hypothetical protein
MYVYVYGYSDYLSDDEQSVTAESALLGDSFQTYIPDILFFLRHINKFSCFEIFFFKSMRFLNLDTLPLRFAGTIAKVNQAPAGCSTYHSAVEDYDQGNRKCCLQVENQPQSNVACL